MKKTFYTLGLATVLLTGVAGAGFAATESNGGALSSQSAVETQTGSQVAKPSGGAMPSQTRTNAMGSTAYSAGQSTTAQPQAPVTAGTGEAGGAGAGSGGNGGASR